MKNLILNSGPFVLQYCFLKYFSKFLVLRKQDKTITGYEWKQNVVSHFAQQGWLKWFSSIHLLFLWCKVSGEKEKKSFASEINSENGIRSYMRCDILILQSFCTIYKEMQAISDSFRAPFDVASASKWTIPTDAPFIKFSSHTCSKLLSICPL